MFAILRGVDTVPINHLMGWTAGQWALNIALVFVWLLVTLIFPDVLAWAASGYDRFVATRLAYTSAGVVVDWVAALAGGALTLAGVVWSLVHCTQQFFEVARHCSTWLRSFAVFAGILVVVVALAYAVAHLIDEIDPVWLPLIPVAPFALLGLGAVLGDGVYRVAAAIPITVGIVVLAGVLFGAWCWAQMRPAR